MVGQWWTPEADLGTLTVAANKRQVTSTAWQHFSDELRQQLTGSLSPDIQKGMTADNLRDAFTWGADQAGGVAKTNGVISESHGAAHRCASELNSRLKTIADEGKSEIDQIQQSKDLPPVKLGKIVEVVMRCQQDANSAAAPSTQNVFEAMQNILDQRGIPVSARQFAQQHGIDTTRMLGSPSKETITNQVKGLLGEGGPPSPPPGDSPRTFGSRTEEPAPAPTFSPADSRTLAQSRRVRSLLQPQQASGPKLGPRNLRGPKPRSTSRGSRGKRRTRIHRARLDRPTWHERPAVTQCMDVRRSAQRIWSIGPVGRTTAQCLHARVRPRLEPGRTDIGGTE